MKKMMIALTALALQSSFADTVRTFQSPGQWECTYISSGNVCYIFGYGGVNPGTSVTFPSSVYDAGAVKTYTVNQLGNGTGPVFTNQQGNETQKIQSITVPGTVQQINSYAFSNLQFLTVANTGSATIKPNALPPNIQSVTVGGDIENSAFEGQQNLTSVTLQDGVRSIGSKAFKNCKRLTSLSIPKTVTYIAPDAFEGSGIKHVVLQRGNVSLKSFPKGIYATVQLLPYPKK